MATRALRGRCAGPPDARLRRLRGPQGASGQRAPQPESAADPDRRRRHPRTGGRRLLREAVRRGRRRLLRTPAGPARGAGLVTSYVAQRLFGLVPVLFGISVVIFLGMKLIPGDVARALLGPMGTAESLAQLRGALGLDQPLHVQYVKWLWRALHGDLGLSPIVHQPVVELLLPKFGNTLILAGASFVLAASAGIAAGVLAAARERTAIDRVTMGASLVVGNMPPFWLGLVLIIVFAIDLRWLPSLGMYSTRGAGGVADLLTHLVLPAVTTAAAPGGGRGRDRRQHQVGEQIGDAAGPTRRVHPEARKPAQVDGEDDDEDQAEPEGRHVADDERGAHGHPIDRGPLARRGQDAGSDAGGGREDEARAGEDQRVAELRQQQLDDGLMHDRREAEV